MRGAISTGIALAAGLTVAAPEAFGCGCFAPPIAAEDFAVNQRAEQIIFEVSGTTVSAHVRIFYEGDPEQFGWLLPLPSVPDLELSNGALFGLIDAQTSPTVIEATADLCPQQKYVCRSHTPCSSGEPVDSPDLRFGEEGETLVTEVDNVGASVAAPPPVEVLARERIGSYDTVTFAADESELAVAWLNDNGFIINETMSPYMQPYLDTGMVFVASRLVPGANLDEIRPLKLTYSAESASIPLQLTAIAAEPHMMVTAFIYGDRAFEPAFLPLISVPDEQLATVGRSNYPMVFSRAVDDAGGNAFVEEFVGEGPLFQDASGCCDGSRLFARQQGEFPDPATAEDTCRIGDDGICQCPESGFDAADCGGQEELVEATKMARALWSKYPRLTRLSTRVSPEEMTFNPEFVPTTEERASHRIALTARRFDLRACEALILDEDDYRQILDLELCSSTYCDYGECVVTDAGAGCACEDGFVARAFVDIDGEASISCVPEVGTVDFAAGGVLDNRFRKPKKAMPRPTNLTLQQHTTMHSLPTIGRPHTTRRTRPAAHRSAQ
jgi:hypothetical protein